jgi:hypothetical protein
MKLQPPTPALVFGVLFALALFNFISRGGVPDDGSTGAYSTGRAAGYLFGSFLLPILITVGYGLWYRRRRRAE